jgi:hypothetical protein
MSDTGTLEKAVLLEAAETTSATDSSTVPLQGHVDVVEENKVYGWAWNPANPLERLLIDVIDAGEGTVVATGLADQTREDLVKSEIGDGFYAFSIDVVGALGMRNTGRLRVVARRLQGQERLDLGIPDTAPAKASVLEAEIVVQEIRERDKRLWGGLRQLAQVTQNNAKPKEVLSAAQRLEDAATRIETALQEFTKQNGGFDSVQMRFDKMISDITTRMDALEKRKDTVLSTTAMLTWAIVASLTALVLGVMMLILR